MRWCAVVLWCGLIFFLSGIPDLHSGLRYDTPLRKAAHVLEYAVLMALWLRAADLRLGPEPRRLALGALFCVLYAVSDEYHQTFVPGRSGRLSDVGIDSIGVILAAARRVTSLLRRY